MNEHASRPAAVPRIAPEGLALAGTLALLAAVGPSPAGATRPPPLDVCAALGLCFSERVPGFGEEGRHGLPRGGTALAGARGRSRRPGSAARGRLRPDRIEVPS